MITETIGAHTYELEPLLASECLKVWPLIAGCELKDLATGVSKALGERPELTKEVAKLFASKCFLQAPDGSKPCLGKTFETHFAGNIYGLIQWLVWCIAMNFSGFSST